MSFIHNYPGTVRTPLFDGVGGPLFILLRFAMKTWSWIAEMLGLRGFVSLSETGERHVFLGTSEAFKPKMGEAAGVPVVAGVELQRGTDGVKGSGMYSVDWVCESASVEVDALLAELRQKGVRDEVWKHNMGEFDRIKSSK